jgi:hypothetical protein
VYFDYIHPPILLFLILLTPNPHFLKFFTFLGGYWSLSSGPWAKSGLFCLTWLSTGLIIFLQIIAGVCYLRYGTLEAISRKQHFFVPAQTQRTHVQRLSPENKGVSPYIPLQAGYRSKKQDLIHIWLCLILLATLS